MLRRVIDNFSSFLNTREKGKVLLAIFIIFEARLLIIMISGPCRQWRHVRPARFYSRTPWLLLSEAGEPHILSSILLILHTTSLNRKQKKRPILHYLGLEINCNLFYILFQPVWIIKASVMCLYCGLLEVGDPS